MPRSSDLTRKFETSTTVQFRHRHRGENRGRLQEEIDLKETPHSATDLSCWHGGVRECKPGNVAPDAEGASVPEMLWSCVEKRLQHKGFSEESLNFLLSPVRCWEVLDENHQLLEVHFLELRRPKDEEDRAHVDMEGAEAFSLLGDVGVPEADDASEGKLSHKQAIHPPERHLQEVNTL